MNLYCSILLVVFATSSPSNQKTLLALLGNALDAESHGRLAVEESSVYTIRSCAKTVNKN